MDGSFGLNQSLKAGGGLLSPSNRSKQSEKSQTTKGSKAGKETKQPNLSTTKEQSIPKPSKPASKAAASVASAAETLPKNIGPKPRSKSKQRSSSKPKKSKVKKEEKVAPTVEIKAELDTKFKFINSSMIEKLMDMCCDQLDAKLLDLATLIEKNRDNLRWVSHKVKEAEAELKDPLVNSDIPLFKDDFRFFGQLVRSRLAASVMRRNQAQMDKEVSSPQKTMKPSVSQLTSSHKKGTISKGSPLRSQRLGQRSRSKSKSATKKVVYLPAGQASWALVHRTASREESGSRIREFGDSTDSPAISPWETASQLLYRRSQNQEGDSEWLRWEHNSPEKSSPGKRISKQSNGKNLHEEIDPMIDTMIVGDSFKNYTPEELQVKFPKPRGTKAQEVRDQKNKERLTKVLASFRREQELREGRSRSRSRSLSRSQSLNRSGSQNIPKNTQSPPRGIPKTDSTSPRSKKNQEKAKLEKPSTAAKDNLKRRKIKTKSKNSLNDSSKQLAQVENVSRSTSRSNSPHRQSTNQKDPLKSQADQANGNFHLKPSSKVGKVTAISPTPQKDRSQAPKATPKIPSPKNQASKPESRAVGRNLGAGQPASPASERNLSPSLASRGASREGSARERLNRTVTDHPSKLSQSISDIDPKEKFSGKKQTTGSPAKPAVTPVRTKVISPTKPNPDLTSKRPVESQPGITKINLKPLDVDKSRDKTPTNLPKKPLAQPAQPKATKPEVSSLKISASSPPPSKVGKPAEPALSKPLKSVSPSPVPKKPEPSKQTPAPAPRADKSPAPVPKPEKKQPPASPPPVKKEQTPVSKPAPAASKPSVGNKAPFESGKKDNKTSNTPVKPVAKNPPEASPPRRRIGDSSRRPGLKVS